MAFVLIGLITTAFFYITYFRVKKGKKLFRVLFCIFFCLSLLLSAISLAQSTYLKNECIKINGLVTFDEENYPQTHFVNLYQNIHNTKIYTVENFCGLYIFREVTLTEGAEPIFVNSDNSIPYENNIPLYSSERN